MQCLICGRGLTHRQRKAFERRRELGMDRATICAGGPYCSHQCSGMAKRLFRLERAETELKELREEIGGMRNGVV